MSPQAAHTAFYVHTHGCEACEAVRIDKARYPSPANFNRWHSRACKDGKVLLEAWKAAIDIHLLERSPFDLGESA